MPREKRQSCHLIIITAYLISFSILVPQASHCMYLSIKIKNKALPYHLVRITKLN